MGKMQEESRKQAGDAPVLPSAALFGPDCLW